MFKPAIKWVAVALPILSIIFAIGCGALPSHPNQIDAFDGQTYDTLLLAHGALTSLRVNVTTSYPKYAPVFNQAVAAYGAAYTTYSNFRMATTTEAEVAVTLSGLTIAIVSLENAFEMDMHASTASMAEIRARARKLRSSAGKASIPVSDLLTELEIAAAIANTIPQAGPYAQLAQTVIQTTIAALAAESAAAGQPIDLAPIQPIPAIS